MTGSGSELTQPLLYRESEEGRNQAQGEAGEPQLVHGDDAVVDVSGRGGADAGGRIYETRGDCERRELQGDLC